MLEDPKLPNLARKFMGTNWILPLNQYLWSERREKISKLEFGLGIDLFSLHYHLKRKYQNNNIFLHKLLIQVYDLSLTS